uniref:Uncharacterized protein n=1 Tax=Anguilla anguilla TaxID=7936 RepID=A0A0E9XVE9_ANGAN
MMAYLVSNTAFLGLVLFPPAAVLTTGDGVLTLSQFFSCIS